MKGSLRLRPWTVKKALPFVRRVHRRLPKLGGAMWAVQVRAENVTVGVALVGHPSPIWTTDEYDMLAVLRVAVVEGHPNACSMLYGACSKMARGSGVGSLVTYTHGDEHGRSLKASGWICHGLTDGGEWDRPGCGRQRELAVDPLPKWRWFAAWSEYLKDNPPILTEPHGDALGERKMP